MKFSILTLIFLSSVACSNPADKKDSADTVVFQQKAQVDTLNMIPLDSHTDCLNAACDSFILTRVLNNELQLSVSACNLDESFNTAHLSILGKTFLIDSILLNKEVLPPANINGIFRLKTLTQEFVVICTIPKHLSGTRGWKHATILFQIIEGKPKFAMAFNSITLHDPEIFSCMKELNTNNEKLEISVWENYEGKANIYQIDSGRVSLIKKVEPKRPQ